MSTPTKILKVRKVWTTKAGQKIPIYQMTDQHVLNTIKMLERVAQRTKEAELLLAWRVSAMVQGEEASAAIDSCIDRMIDDPSADDFLHPLYDDLVLDAERRGLKLD